MPTGARAPASVNSRQQDKLEQQANASQADTEPLSFDEDDAESDPSDLLHDASAHSDPKMDGSAAQDALDAVVAAAPLEASGTNTPAGDTSMVSAEQSFDDDAEGEDDDAEAEDEDAEGEDEEEEEEPDIIGTQVSQRRAAAEEKGDLFSDDSELSDESDDAAGAGEEDDDDDDEMGGDDDEDADGEDDEDEDAEGEDEEDEGQEEDEDEAAAGLAALTAGAQVDTAAHASDGANQQSGLDSLAVLAAAQDSEHDSDTDSIASSRRSTKLRRIASQPKASSRLKEVTAASSIGADSDTEGADEEARPAAEGDGTHTDDGNEDEREMSSLGGLSAAAKKKAARAGPGAGLLAGAPAITVEESASGAPSAATSREGSPKDDEEGEGAEETHTGDEGEDGSKEEDKEAEDEATTPAHDAAEEALEEDPSTDEAAVKRQEAMDALSKIEVGFAVLRDKLYIERMDEVNKESEMILDGTHPDLLYLTNLIEARRERRLRLAERYFEQQESQYERVAHTEEAAAWSNWRNEVATLRRRQMDEISRKKRKLDREKRLLDGPRPARRHQVFETELVRNPHFDEAQARLKPRKKPKRKAQQEIEDLDEMGAYVAYPDLRPAEDQEAWMDMERMGVQPDPRLMQNMPFFRMEEMGMDPNGMFMGEGYPPQGEMLQPMHDGPGGDRQFEGGAPPGYMVDGYGNAMPPQMFDAQPPRGRSDGQMQGQQLPVPQSQPSQAARKQARKASPGAPSRSKPTANAQEDRPRKSDHGNGSAAKRANANAQGRTPPSHPRPAPGPPVQQHSQGPPHQSGMGRSMPHPNDGGMQRPPPPGGPPYMSYGGGGMHGNHMADGNDGYYGGQGPPPMPPGPPMHGPGPAHSHFQQHGPPPPNIKGNMGPNLPPLQRPPSQQPPRGRPGAPPSPISGGPPPGMSPFDARRPPGEPMYTR